MSARVLSCCCRRAILAAWWALCALGAPAGADTWTFMPLSPPPADLSPHFVTSMAVAPNGELTVAFHQGGGVFRRSAAGQWSEIAPQGVDLGSVSQPQRVAVGGGSLFVIDWGGETGVRLQARSPQGQWSLLRSSATDLTADSAGVLYVSEGTGAGSRVLRREPGGGWTVLAVHGDDLGQVSSPGSLDVDEKDNLYVVDAGNGRIQKRAPDGTWSVIASEGLPLTGSPTLRAAADGTLYLAGGSVEGVWRREPKSGWRRFDPSGGIFGPRGPVRAMDVDADGNVYLAYEDYLLRLDLSGAWSLIGLQLSFHPEAVRGSLVSSVLGLGLGGSGTAYVPRGGPEYYWIERVDSEGAETITLSFGSPSPVLTSFAFDPRGGILAVQRDPVLGRDVLIASDTGAEWSPLRDLGSGGARIWMDPVGSLLVSHSDTFSSGLHSFLDRRSPQGVWGQVEGDVLPDGSLNPGGWVWSDASGCLYVAGNGLRRRCVGEGETVLALSGTNLGQVTQVRDVVGDAEGNLYVSADGRIQRRDPRGVWSVLSPPGAPTPFDGYLEVDAWGRLWIASDSGLYQYTPDAVPVDHLAPSAEPQSVTTAEDTPVAITLTGSDPEGAPISFEVVTPPQHGSLSGSAPQLTYTPAADFFGTDSFSFRVSDGSLNSAVAAVEINVTPVNDVPQAVSAALTTQEDTPVPAPLAGTDVEGSDLTFAVVEAPAHGTLSGEAPNLTYTPAPDFHGTDRFSYTASDGQATSDRATVTITVTPVNDPPVAEEQTLRTLGSIPITLSGSDADGDPLTFEVVSPPSFGTLTGTPPNLVYTPQEGFRGTDGLSFRVSDGQAESPIVRVRLEVVSTPGDLTGDGAVTVSDVLVAVRMVVGLEPGTPSQRAAADTNRDGTVDVGDVIRLIRLVLRL